MMTLKSISKIEFSNSKSPAVFHDENHARYFYSLIYNDIETLVFSAQSEIKPEILVIDKVIVVGCDQIVAFFNVDDSQLIKKILLPCFFYYFYVTEEYLFIVCEVELIILYKNSFDECRCFQFTEYIDHIEINNRKVSVIFIGGSCEEIEI